MKKREVTKIEIELHKRGYRDKEIWILVQKKTKGMTRMQLHNILDNAHYELGVQHIENIAMACGVSYLTVVDWVRLDKKPELMTKAEFELYRKRMVQLDNADQIRWYLALMCRKKIPLFYVMEEIMNKSNFKKPRNGYVNKGDYIYHKYIKTGLFKPTKGLDGDGKDKK